MLIFVLLGGFLCPCYLISDYCDNDNKCASICISFVMPVVSSNGMSRSFFSIGDVVFYGSHDREVVG
jgi:hypothetical protein